MPFLSASKQFGPEGLCLRLVSCPINSLALIATHLPLSQAVKGCAYPKIRTPFANAASAVNVRNPFRASAFWRSAALARNDDASASPNSRRLAESPKGISSGLSYLSDRTLVRRYHSYHGAFDHSSNNWHDLLPVLANEEFYRLQYLIRIASLEA